MIIIIGSVALLQHLCRKGVDFRNPADIDLMTSLDELNTLVKTLNVKRCYPIENGTKFVFDVLEQKHEAEITWEGSTAEMLSSIVKEDPLTEKLNNGMLIPSLDLLYTIKLSHRFKKNSKHFLKTMRDIQLMRKLGATVNPKHVNFFTARQAEAINYQHPKLNVTKRNFFTEIGDVKYIYNHDTIHEAVKHLDNPAYTYFKQNNSEVLTSRELWNKSPEHIKLFSILEEAYVLALERSQIPYPNSISPLQSFTVAMEKVCTNISSGWWREYAWENYDKVFELFNENYVDRFHIGVERGIVKIHLT